MPQIITAAVTAVGVALGGASGAVLIMYSTQIATALATIGTLAYGYSRQRRAERRARAAYNASLQDRLLTVRSAISPRHYVLGTVRTGGTLLYGETIGENSVALDTIVAYAANRCELVGYYLGDEFVAPGDWPGDRYGAQQVVDTQERFTATGPTATVTLAQAPRSVEDVSVHWSHGVFDSFDNGLATIVSLDGEELQLSGLPAQEVDLTVAYKYIPTDKIRVIFRDGAPDQASTSWDDYPAPKWTADHRLRGVCHARTLMIWDENLYATGAPTVGAVLRGGAVDGHPIYDPRIDDTLSYSDNPAVLAGWWMTLPRHSGGMGIPAEWIDWESVSAAANVCDELITVRTLDGEGYEQIKRYQCHAVLSTDAPPAENLDIILSAMAGKRVFTAGQYRLYAGAFRAATVTLTDDDIVGTKPLTVLTAAGDDAPPNIVTARFSDASRGWIETSPRPVRNDAYIALDGHESPLDLQLPATTDSRQANYLMGVALESARPAFSAQMTIRGAKGEDLALGDTLQLDLSEREAYTGHTFEVIARVDNWDGTFEITLAEIKASTYALDADRYTPAPDAPTPPPDPVRVVAPLTGFAATLSTPVLLPDGTSVATVALSWDLHTQAYVRDGGRIELRYRQATTEQWSGIPSVPGSATGTSVSIGLRDGAYYTFQGRAVNPAGAASEWAQAQILPEGSPIEDGPIDSTPPPTPTGLTAVGGITYVIIEWDKPGYTQGGGHDRTNLYGAIWADPANDPEPTFEDAELIAAVPAAAYYALATAPMTTWCLWAKHQSVAGVESEVPAGGEHGVQVTTGADVGLLLDLLHGQITESELFASLGARIDLIDGGGPGSVNARIATESAARVAGDNALASQITQLSASTTVRPNLLRNGGFEFGLEGMTGTLTGFIVADNSWGRSLSRTSGGGATGAIAWPAFPVFAGSTYSVTADTLLSASAGQVYLDLQFWSGANGTGTLLLDGPQNPLGNHGFSTGNTNRNAHAVSAVAPAGAVSATARFVWAGVSGLVQMAVRQAKVELGGLPMGPYTAETSAVQTVVALQQEAFVRASADGELYAQWTVKIDANGYVSGFGLASTAGNATPFSEFLVRADRFAIASPSGPGITPIVPFIVNTTTQTINGITVPPGVYMDAAFVKNGTITSAKIGNAVIDNAKIVNAAVDTLKIQGEAVTVPRAAEAIGSSSITYTVPAQGGDFPALIIGSFTKGNLSGAARIQLYVEPLFFPGPAPIVVSEEQPGAGTVSCLAGMVWLPAGNTWRIWARFLDVPVGADIRSRIIMMGGRR